MRKVAQLALRQADKAGAFLIIHEHELEALDTLPLWFHRLWTHLLRCADHSSGRGQTTYAALLAKLVPIQPRRGPRHEVPTLQALKRAVDTLEDRRLIARDALHSQAVQALIFQVAPRYAKARPTPKPDPQSRPPVDNRKASIGAASSPVAPETRPPILTPSSAMKPCHIKEGKLSTDSAQPTRPQLRGIRDELARRGGEN